MHSLCKSKGYFYDAVEGLRALPTCKELHNNAHLLGLVSITHLKFSFLRMRELDCSVAGSGSLT